PSTHGITSFTRTARASVPSIASTTTVYAIHRNAVAASPCTVARMARSPAGALLAVRRCTPHAAACRARLAGTLWIGFTSSRGQPEHLHEVAVRVAAVEGHRPVTVLPWLPRDRHAARAQALGGGMDLFRRVDDEPEMIESAAGGHLVRLVQRQVVRP